jgi:hypothetical protein
VHDGIHFDRAGIPAATICTDHFVNTAQATATVWGVPDYPVLYMPHPLSALSDDAIRAEARKLADQVVQVLMAGTLEA